MSWQFPALKVESETLMNMMDKGKPPVVLDVRTSSEFMRGAVPNAVHVSVFNIAFEHKDLAISRKEPIIVYCNSGVRARVAALFLTAAGFESIYLLREQLNGWKQRGYPVVVPA